MNPHPCILTHACVFVYALFMLITSCRFLAFGDSIISMSYQYLLGLTTVSNIISETCDALWSVLSKDVLPYPFTKEKQLSISKEFEEIQDFNHCIGVINDKYIIIQVS